MRPSQAKTGGGGFLNGVAALITGYEFVESKDMEIKKGKRAGQTWSPVSGIVAFRVDGADADVTSRFLLGDSDKLDLTISEDGQVVTLGPDVHLFADNEVIAFVSSLTRNNFPEELFDEDPTILDLTPIVGTRVNLEQVVNEEKTKQQGKQISAKTGAAYDRKDLQVASIISLPDAKKAGKAAPGKKSVASKGTDIAALAAETLVELLADADDNVIAFPKLKMKVFGKLQKHADRDAVLKFLGDSTNLPGIDGIAFDSKKQNISLA